MLNRDMRRVWWADEDCERMTRHEMDAVRSLLGAVSYVASAADDLKKRLECIPGGRQRMAMIRGGIKAIADDIVGTMTRAQCQQIKNTMDDLIVRMVPKYTPSSHNVILTEEETKELVEACRERCKMCIATDAEARRCKLYKVLEGLIPLDDYGDGQTCPYYTREFE